MIAEIEAFRDAVTTAGVPCFIGQVPSTTPMPYASLSAPSWGETDDPTVCRAGDEAAVDVRLLVTDTTESNAHTRLGLLRATLTPGLSPTRLAVAGRYVTVEWVRSEFVGTDRDVTVPGTNKHPGFGVDTYRVVSQPA